MKKLLPILLSILSLATPIMANDSFDETQNYQGNNANAYEGEILLVMPLREGEHPYYWWFFDYDLFDDDWNCENDILYYHRAPLDKFGNDPRYLEGKSFKVFYVRPLQDYTYTWVFHLVNVADPSDKCKFIYHGDWEVNRKGSQQVFPFLTQKHAKYLHRILYNKNVYVSTVKQTNSSYKAACTTDINGNPISYTKPYAKFKVIGIDIDRKTAELMLTLTNGTATTKELYAKRLKPMEDGKYTSDVKVFTEAEWNKMVAKYGIKHMEAIMSGDIIEGMTYNECVLSNGIPDRKKSKRLEYSWLFGKQYRTYKFDTEGNMIADLTDPDDVVSLTNVFLNVLDDLSEMRKDAPEEKESKSKVKSKVNSLIEKVKSWF